MPSRAGSVLIFFAVHRVVTGTELCNADTGM